MKTLRLILGDQLNRKISSLHDLDRAGDIVLICEVIAEATYVRHHKKKIVLLFSAMRHFADELRQDGVSVDYIQLKDRGNTGSFRGEAARAIARHGAEKLVVTFPGEYRVWQDMRTWEEEFGIPVEILPDARFLCPPRAFRAWADSAKTPRMEFFYRRMRKELNVLMTPDGQPEGGQWNFDHDNRAPPPRSKDGLPAPLAFAEDETTQTVMTLVAENFSGHFGDIEPFGLAVTRAQALQALADFIDIRLPEFGRYQDAMLEDEDYLYHSRLSFYMNCGLLDAREVVDAAENAYWEGRVPLNSAEGFIRQIIGWREYVRGIYWYKMPGYAQENFLNATRALPDLFWSGETQMNCMYHSVQGTIRNAYAHHIQRLMVIGNFCLLTGMDPAEVNEWYLIVYADAYEWVEMPNVTGLILYADGGLTASKPYVAGGAYIDRMSDYCGNCRYNVKLKTGEDACPFNYLYWNFLIRHRETFRDNPRMAMTYRTLDKMSDARRLEIKTDSRNFLDGLKPYIEE